MLKDALGDRMKGYENVNRNYLIRRMPVIIRIDGKAFHTFTKGFQRPFDDILAKSMQDTMQYLCSNIQGCVFGYTQSDEISLVLIDYQLLDTSAWFDYNIQKMASVASSMATLAFNRAFTANVKLFEESTSAMHPEKIDSVLDYLNTLLRARDKGALFDARVFNLPKEDVVNCILWRQNDATRNSIESVGHTYFSQKELHKKNCNEIQDMLFLQRNINWNDYPTKYKRGCSCIRCEDENGRHKWIVDTEMPILKGEDRKYLNDLILYYE